ncbi:uncharacterized protein [Procambarus clarkii]|uniref:uncharacterized protein isoform X1 n=1 Tax=Procambarus clarkii TaxID=6728 RepID=UPI003742B5AA
MQASATHQEDDLQQYGEEDASYTEEEIERAFREDFPTNDFWTDENNVDILQCILDKEFNSEPGYEYEASYMDYSTPRLIVICLLCGFVELKSYYHFMSHDKGKAHYKKRASVQQMSVQPPQPAKGVSGVKLGMFYKSFPTGSLEKEIIDSTVPIIGVSFIFKEIYYNQMTFSCQLCQMSRINQENMLTHLKSYEHTNRYVEVKFQEKLTKAELKVRRKEIMELEGKLHHPIKDFSSHLPLELQCGSSLSSLCEDVADVSLHSKSRTCLSVCTSLPVDTTLTDKQKQRAKSFPPKLLKFITQDEMRQARRMMLCKWLLDCARQDGNDHNVKYHGKILKLLSLQSHDGNK